MNPTQPQQPPSEEKLKFLLMQDGMAPVVQQLIDTFKLNYKIEDGQLKDSLLGTDKWLRKFITVDPETQQLKDDILKLSKCDDEVLIRGETGTGKETLARALIGNRESMDTGNRSIVVNCAGLPENLIESELFGHVKGAFTDAHTGKKGLITYAGGGIMFLDEVGELPLGVQGKLLRVLEDRRLRPVGGNDELEVRCKFVFATNKNIYKMVEAGLFRQDLYARIGTFEFEVKPLRNRKCDIEPICRSLPKGPEFYGIYEDQLQSGLLGLEHNVRSLKQHVKRWSVLGRV